MPSASLKRERLARALVAETSSFEADRSSFFSRGKYTPGNQ
jgi:hypothetical protein